MIWARLLDYEPAHQAKDTRQNPELWALVDLGDQELLLMALRKHFESGGSLDPDLGMAVCNLLERKKPAHRPGLSETELEQRAQWFELVALELGRLRVGCILEGQPLSWAEVQVDRQWCAIIGVAPETTPWRDFLRQYRKAVYVGEFRELERLLQSGAISLDGEEYQRWAKNIDYRHKALIQKARERLELLYN